MTLQESSFHKCMQVLPRKRKKLFELWSVKHLRIHTDGKSTVSQTVLPQMWECTGNFPRIQETVTWIDVGESF